MLNIPFNLHIVLIKESKDLKGMIKLISRNQAGNACV